MSSSEPTRVEYERRVLGRLRKHFLENGRHLGYHGGRIEFEDVRLENSGPEDSSVVITFRALNRTGRLFGRREDAVGPPAPWEDNGNAPELWAQMVLEEDILSGPRLPKKCEPGSTVWV